MSIWLALALPALPLQLAQRALDGALARSLALAIVDGPAQRSQVLFCNDTARSAGVTPGMKLAAAQALVRELVALEYRAEQEQAALQELACWAYQFSSAIVPFHDGSASGILVETGGSERLFGGRQALHRRIRGALRSLGYHASFAAAATPAAARLLAQARALQAAAPAAAADLATVETAQLPAALAPLPLQLLGWPPAGLQLLQSLGLATIGDVLALPRDAFARRFGAMHLVELDRLLGSIADPQPPFAPPERFQARVELPADLTDVAQLQTPLRHLLRLLEGFLRGRGAGATALVLRAHHNRRRDQPAAPTPIALALALPERDAQRLERLFTERLARTSLPEPAVLLELQLERMADFLPGNASFLPPAPDSAQWDTDALHLAETLHARLGSAGVFQLQTVDDHRPELAYRVLPPGPGAPQRAATIALPAQRPVLILPAPQLLSRPAAAPGTPAHGAALTLLAGPERIEAGWWDLGYQSHPPVHRDYFVARNPRGQTLWIYRELVAPHRWFLHGYFG